MSLEKIEESNFGLDINPEADKLFRLINNTNTTAETEFIYKRPTHDIEHDIQNKIQIECSLHVKIHGGKLFNAIIRSKYRILKSEHSTTIEEIVDIINVLYKDLWNKTYKTIPKYAYDDPISDILSPYQKNDLTTNVDLLPLLKLIHTSE